MSTSSRQHLREGAVASKTVGMKGTSAQKVWSKVPFIYVVLFAGLIVVGGPFVWMVLGSLKPESEIREIPPTWLPESWTLENYRQLFDQLSFPQFFANSVVVAGAVTIGNLVFCTMLGYALAKIDFPARRVLFLLVLGTLMIPGVVTFVPLFVLVVNLGLVNTFAGLILPFLAQPIGVFLMRQYISGLPDELIDAARIDGAGEFRILARIIAPLCTPALATLAIITFLAQWNSFLWPLVVAQSEEKYTLPVALALYAVGQNQLRFDLIMAGAVVVVIPVLVIFIALQRFFVQGIATTGLK